MCRVVSRVRPEVGGALHGCRRGSNPAVISTGRSGRRTPARNIEAAQKELGDNDQVIQITEDCSS